MEARTVPKTTLLCDFCNESVAEVRTFEAAPISMKVKETAVYLCDSKWAACPICAQMIDENHWDELTGRSYDLWLNGEGQRGVHPDTDFRQFMKTYITRLHQLFREARGGTV